jgi:hypothetical protein
VIGGDANVPGGQFTAGDFASDTAPIGKQAHGGTLGRVVAEVDVWEGGAPAPGLKRRDCQCWDIYTVRQSQVLSGGREGGLLGGTSYVG